MRFGRWYPLSEAAVRAPSTPGMFQIRVRDGLIDYPTGKSAMIHYCHADNVRAGVVTFAADHPNREWLCRHLEPLAETDASRSLASYERLMTEFRRRFGASPTLPK